MNIPIAVEAQQIHPRTKPTNYPQPFVPLVAGRIKRTLGEVFGLTNFGVNLTCLGPGSMSALRHAHATQDEFVYILEGSPTLVTDQGATLLHAGMCAGFKAGTGDGHHLVNRTKQDVLYLEIGDRSAGDSVVYPDDDLRATFGEDGQWKFSHKNGAPY
ncbi:MAG: cupin domain-containing protein [Burkholderiales bacterium]